MTYSNVNKRWGFFLQTRSHFFRTLCEMPNFGVVCYRVAGLYFMLYTFVAIEKFVITDCDYKRTVMVDVL